jgi:translation elongation factor EF-Ts
MAEGVVIQDGEGNLYFIRPEVLESAKLPKSMHKDAATALKAGAKTKLKVVGALTLVSGDEKQTEKVSQLATRGAALKPKSVSVKELPLGARASTIMCPW